MPRRPHSNRNNYNRPATLVSHCQGVTARGTASQICLKYMSMATETNDQFVSEDFRQHAEHYGRIATGAPC